MNFHGNSLTRFCFVLFFFVFCFLFKIFFSLRRIQSLVILHNKNKKTKTKTKNKKQKTKKNKTKQKRVKEFPWKFIS
jgi:predicted membrane protein